MIWGSRSPAPGAPPATVGPYRYGSAGSPEIARKSGGDSLSINDAGAVETTFERIRKRYAIYFQLPEGMTDARRGLELDLTDAARRRYPDASMQYRQITLAKDGAMPGLISRVPAHPPTGRDSEPAQTDSAATARRRSGVSDSSGMRVTLPLQAPADQPADTTAPPPATHRRGVNEPGSAPRVSLPPSQ